MSATAEQNKCDFCGEIKIVSRQYLHAKNKPKTGNGFTITMYCSDCGLDEQILYFDVLPIISPTS